MKFKSSIELQSLDNATVDTDKFLVSDGDVIKFRTGAQVLSDIGAQAALTNPITGTGTSGQVSFWTGAGTQGGSSNFNWNNGTSSLRILTTSQIGGSSVTIRRNNAIALALDINSTESNDFSAISWNGSTSSLGGLNAQSAAIVGYRAGAGAIGRLGFWTRSGTTNTERWTIESTGILQSNGAQTIRTSTGNLTLATAGGNGDIILSPNGTGNVGIGTTAPGAKLHVVGDTYIQGTEYIFQTVNNTAGYLYFDHSGTQVWKQGIFNDNTSTFSIGNGGGFTRLLNITNDGNVGIGTTTPAYKLDVNGSLHSSNLTIADGIFHEGDTNTFIGFPANDTFRITTSGQARLTVDSVGRVGIGTLTPSYGLDVGSNIRAVSAYVVGTGTGTLGGDNNIFTTASNSAFLNLKGGSKRAKISIGNDQVELVSGNDAISFRTGATTSTNRGTERVRITAGGAMGLGVIPTNTSGRFEASNDIVAFSSSDIRWKTNIKNIDSPLDKISKLNGVTFDWIEDEPIHGNKGHDIGVIAQEVEKVLPEIVDTRDSGMKAVKYEKLIPLLIESIKDQQNQINELKEIINGFTK
jgi:hypothetical protein